jgi:hypothetical protein
MKRLRILTAVALHEMWISFRLILVIGLPVLGGMMVIVLPPELAGATAVGGAGFWYAVAACATICIASGLAAGTLAHERRRGTVAWMAVRAVPRSAVMLSWFLAFGLLLTAGIALGSIGAWLAAIAHADSPPDFGPFAASIVATAAAALASVAAGLLLGAFLRTVPATVLAVVLSAAILAAAIAWPLGAVPLPTGGIGLLAHLNAAARPIGDALQSAGTALAAAALLLVLAGAGLERSDL